MRPAERIIQKFGGIRPMAAALNVPVSTVQNWKESGLIPAGRQQRILDRSLALGIDLTPADFFDPPEPAAPAKGQAA